MDGECEFWRARELHKLLGYDRWENFEKVIAKRSNHMAALFSELPEQFAEQFALEKIPSINLV
jgi:DNA-damage-inducible protein D